LVSAKDPRGLPVLAVGSGAAMGYLGTGEFARDQDATHFLQNMMINGVPVIERPGNIGMFAGASQMALSVAKLGCLIDMSRAHVNANSIRSASAPSW
jgi:hypothetical protein